MGTKLNLGNLKMKKFIKATLTSLVLSIGVCTGTAVATDLDATALNGEQSDSSAFRYCPPYTPTIPPFVWGCKGIAPWHPCVPDYGCLIQLDKALVVTQEDQALLIMCFVAGWCRPVASYFGEGSAGTEGEVIVAGFIRDLVDLLKVIAI